MLMYLSGAEESMCVWVFVCVSALMCTVCEKCWRLCVGVELVEGMLMHSDRLELRLYPMVSSLDNSQPGELNISPQLQENETLNIRNGWMDNKRQKSMVLWL